MRTGPGQSSLPTNPRDFYAHISPDNLACDVSGNHNPPANDNSNNLYNGSDDSAGNIPGPDYNYDNSHDESDVSPDNSTRHNTGNVNNDIGTHDPVDLNTGTDSYRTAARRFSQLEDRIRDKLGVVPVPGNDSFKWDYYTG